MSEIRSSNSTMNEHKPHIVTIREIESMFDVTMAIDN